MTITIFHDRKHYRYKVDLIEVTPREEIYQLTARNKTLILKNNRPILKAKKLKHWKMTWRVEGEIWNEYFKELIIKEIEGKI